MCRVLGACKSTTKVSDICENFISIVISYIQIEVFFCFHIFAARRQSLDCSREACFRQKIDLFWCVVCLSICLCVRTNEILRIKNYKIKNLEYMGFEPATGILMRICYPKYTTFSKVVPLWLSKLVYTKSPSLGLTFLLGDE